MEIILDIIIMIGQFILGISAFILFPVYIANSMGSEKKKSQDWGILLAIVFFIGMVVIWGEGMREDEIPTNQSASTSITK